MTTAFDKYLTYAGHLEDATGELMGAEADCVEILAQVEDKDALKKAIAFLTRCANGEFA